MSTTYIVKKGDCLWNIAKAHGLTLGELLAANPQFTKSQGRDPNLIYPGEAVTIPSDSKLDKGSDLAKGGRDCDTKKVLEGEVIEVTFKSGIKVALAKKPVPTPHWKVGLALDDGKGSKRPAVYLIKGKATSQAVDVKVKITKSEHVSGPGTLEAKLGTLKIKGACPVTTGEHLVNAMIETLPDAIAWAKGDVGWQLNVKDLGRRVTLANKTRLEVFVILDKPAACFKKGVWAEALRLLCEKVGVIGKKTDQPAASAVTNYFHGSHGLKYDTTSGSPSYGVGPYGGTFKLGGYLTTAKPRANCYDQAGAVQTFCGALGIKTTWDYLGRPPGSKIFGLINAADLLGVGPCNNPFFKNPAYTNKPVVPVTDKGRSGFGNHAFIELAGKVHDACAGPHRGTETPKQYLAAAVDTAETKRRGLSVAAASDIDQSGSVADLR